MTIAQFLILMIVIFFEFKCHIHNIVQVKNKIMLSITHQSMTNFENSTLQTDTLLDAI